MLIPPLGEDGTYTHRLFGKLAMMIPGMISSCSKHRLKTGGSWYTDESATCAYTYSIGAPCSLKYSTLPLSDLEPDRRTLLVSTGCRPCRLAAIDYGPI